MKNKKIITYSLSEDGNGGLIVQPKDVDNLLETLRSELENAQLDEDNSDDEIEFIIKVEKRLTQEEVDTLEEFDGF